MLPWLIFDIETGPVPDLLLDTLMPQFEAAGNLKDPDKIAADVANKQKNWRDRAALSPMTGMVVGVGIALNTNSRPRIVLGGERKLVTRTLDEISRMLMAGGTVYGFNIHAFDLPFLVTRARMLRIHVPANLITTYHNRTYWADGIVDLMQLWTMGGDRAGNSLNAVSRFLGFGEKKGDAKDFALLLASKDRADRRKAQAYLRQDILLTRRLMLRLTEQDRTPHELGNWYRRKKMPQPPVDNTQVQ